MTVTAERRHAAPPAPTTAVQRLWRRELEHYPSHAARRRYLGITVAATIVLYYMAFIQGGVGTSLIADYDMSFSFFVVLGILGNGVGALASLAAGFADRWGRANLVVGGLLASALIVLVLLPLAPDKTVFAVFAALLGFVEGVVLVATPALVRDFSPQVGRGQAMGLWTLGPVLGSLTVTLVTSHTLDAHPDWRWQFQVAGAAGLAVFVVALVGLRELSPQLRDQLMVSERDRVLVEARAAGIDPQQALQGHWPQMLKLQIIGPAFAISVFLLLYYALVGFLVVYFATVFGYSDARANSLGNWYWASNAVALVVAGVLSDKLRVRKPFMVVGALVGIVGNVLFALSATDPDTSYRTFVVCFVLSAVGGGLAYVGWMAAFTETVEKRNPAATATGLAIWGLTLRSVVSISLVVLTLIVPATTTLVNDGPEVQRIVATYPAQVEVLTELGPTAALLGRHPDQIGVQSAAVAAITGLDIVDVDRALLFNRDHQRELQTAQAIAPATLAALSADPTDGATITAAVTQIAGALDLSQGLAGDRLLALAASPPATLAYLQQHAAQLTSAADRLSSLSQMPADDLAYLGAHAADVVAAQRDNPGQWQTWWWVCVAGQLVFLLFVPLLSGRWSPSRAREDARKHDRWLDAELALLDRERTAAV